eukprot:1399891-Prymnesium_polylepis.1
MATCPCKSAARRRRAPSFVLQSLLLRPHGATVRCQRRAQGLPGDDSRSNRMPLGNHTLHGLSAW